MMAASSTLLADVPGADAAFFLLFLPIGLVYLAEEAELKFRGQLTDGLASTLVVVLPLLPAVSALLGPLQQRGGAVERRGDEGFQAGVGAGLGRGGRIGRVREARSGGEGSAAAGVVLVRELHPRTARDGRVAPSSVPEVITQRVAEGLEASTRWCYRRSGGGGGQRQQRKEVVHERVRQRRRERRGRGHRGGKKGCGGWGWGEGNGIAPQKCLVVV
mmetsp:Transcript_10129/g.20152  ORF Transcript_10129/g.20152 Transcript_10129/m.20152 type:complete len:217 (+) Transcript_10129:1131-1781(+)